MPACPKCGLTLQSDPLEALEGCRACGRVYAPSDLAPSLIVGRDPGDEDWTQSVEDVD